MSATDFVKLSWIALAMLGVGSVSDASSASISCGKNSQTSVLLNSNAGAQAEIRVEAEHSVWLEIEEHGVTVDVVFEGSEETREMPIPPRHAWRFFSINSTGTLRLQRTQRGDPGGSVSLTLHCKEEPLFQRRIDWLSNAGSFASRLKQQQPLANVDSDLGVVERLTSTAPDATTRAFAKHLRAQTLLLGGRSSDAIGAFADAEAAWSKVGDFDRARVARVARIEDMIRAGGYVSALDLSRSFSGAPSGKSYFATRMERSRCLALTYLGRRAEAEACYAWVLARLEALDERGELANTLQAYAGLEVDGANYAHAEELARRGLDIAEGTDVLLYRGRIHLLLGDIALRRGVIAEALRACDLALSEFAQAQAPRWEANTMLKVAQLHEQLGDYDEAYSFLSGALNRLSARDAPSRWAKGMELFSDLERDHGRLDSAYVWMRAAEHLYAELKMAGDLDAAVMSRLGIELQLGHLGSVAQALSAREPRLPLHATDFNLLAADLDLHLGRFGDARLRLDKLQTEPVSLQTQVYLSTLEGKYRFAHEDIQGALAELLDQGRSIKELAGHTQSGILRALIERQSKPLRKIVFQRALEHHHAPVDSVWTARAVWDWLALNASRSRPPGEFTRTGTNAEKFESAVAAELFLAPSASHIAAESTTQRELLSLLGGQGKPFEAPLRSKEPLQLASLQQALDNDAAFMAFLEGEDRGGVIWITRDRVEIVDSSSPSEVRAHVTALRDLLRTADSPLAAIQAGAERLSRELFGSIPVGQAPARLYVLTEEPFGAVPWTILSWPGSSSFLLDTTTVEYVRLDVSERRDKNPLPTDLQVIIAAQESEHAPLPALAGANAEGAAIARALSNTAAVVQIPSATRATVISALQAPRGWVHIAAHGTAQPQRIGYAGIWLDTTNDGRTPEFLSWIDILDSDVKADLVVLNACQLGDSGTAVNGNLSFADAVSRAGAKHVVAALWPVSDAAAALWVPAFYSAIVADPNHDAAEALRAAQLRLRESRAFRHPFFWAGMQVIDRMPMGSKAAH